MKKPSPGKEEPEKEPEDKKEHSLNPELLPVDYVLEKSEAVRDPPHKKRKKKKKFIIPEPGISFKNLERVYQPQ